MPYNVSDNRSCDINIKYIKMDIQKIIETIDEPKGWLKLTPSNIRELNEYCKSLMKENEQLRLSGVSGRSEQLKCDCCDGIGMVEGDYRDELESCLTCNGRGTF